MQESKFVFFGLLFLLAAVDWGFASNSTCPCSQGCIANLTACVNGPYDGEWVCPALFGGWSCLCSPMHPSGAQMCTLFGGGNQAHH